MHFHYRYAREDWDWFEPELAYDNARLPEALIRAGMCSDEPAMIERGLATLELAGAAADRPARHVPAGRLPGLLPALCAAAGLRPAADRGSGDDRCRRGRLSKRPGDEEWRQVARDAFAWFFGDNDAGVPLGRCRATAAASTG